MSTESTVTASGMLVTKVSYQQGRIILVITGSCSLIIPRDPHQVRAADELEFRVCRQRLLPIRVKNRFSTSRHGDLTATAIQKGKPTKMQIMQALWTVGPSKVAEVQRAC